MPLWIGIGTIVTCLLAIAIWIVDRRVNGRNDTDHQDSDGGWL